MTSRLEQRKATRERIVGAAPAAPAERGFRGASTRDIAQRAGTSQAGSRIFAVAPECPRLTGLDPETPEAVETHADFVARLLVPQPPPPDGATASRSAWCTTSPTNRRNGGAA